MPLQRGRGGRRKRHPECGRARKSGKRTVLGVPAPDPSSSREAVASELRAAGLMSRPEALVALSIAQRLDDGDEPGAALAALSKELRAVLADLRRTASPQSDIFDQLAARRAANGHAAGGA